MPEPRVGGIQGVTDQQGFSGTGFVVYGDNGRPAAVFGFLSDADARVAAKKMNEIIALCKSVQGLA